MWQCASCGNRYPEVVELCRHCRAATAEVVEEPRTLDYGLTEKQSRTATIIAAAIAIVWLITFLEWQHLKHLIGG